MRRLLTFIFFFAVFSSIIGQPTHVSTNHSSTPGYGAQSYTGDLEADGTATTVCIHYQSGTAPSNATDFDSEALLDFTFRDDTGTIVSQGFPTGSDLSYNGDEICYTIPGGIASSGWEIDFNLIYIPDSNVDINFDGNYIQTTVDVKWIRFDGIVDREKVTLEWITGSEISNHYFAIERSFDQEDYVEVSQIDGHGTTNNMHTYSYEELISDVASALYYRVKQVDYNGSFTYSETIVIHVGSHTKKEMLVYPNPTNGILHITGSHGDDIEVTNANGLVVHAGNNDTIDLSDRISGWYVVRNKKNGEYKRIMKL